MRVVCLTRRGRRQCSRCGCGFESCMDAGQCSVYDSPRCARAPHHHGTTTRMRDSGYKHIAPCSYQLPATASISIKHLMQSHPIIHRDISSANVLLDPLTLVTAGKPESLIRQSARASHSRPRKPSLCSS